MENISSRRLLFLNLLLLGAASIHAQPVSNQVSRPLPHYAVGAANQDPTARTLEEIFLVNEKLARQGKTEAAFELGLAYLQGYGAAQNLTQADKWFRVGATSPGEKAIVGALYRDGAYFAKDLHRAAIWYTSAGRPGDFFELSQGYRLATPPQSEEAVAIYLKVLDMPGHPEVRRAQMELGNLVIDGKYSAGDDARGRARNLEWARIITQELLGGEEYNIAIDYLVGRNGISPDKALWLRFCKRAAAYNGDLAQRFYAEAIVDGTAPHLSGYDQIAWMRLASQKHVDFVYLLKTMEANLSAEQQRSADDDYESLVETRKRDGAYYPADDPLRKATPDALASMPQDDPDVQLRTAFMLEEAGAASHATYERALNLYRTVRNRREMDIRLMLGRDLLTGADGFPVDREQALIWLRVASERGSEEAKALLAKLPTQSFVHP